MANSATINVTINATMNNQQFPGYGTTTIVPASNGAIKENQTIATTVTAIAMGGITNCAYLLITNLDPTNYIDVSMESTGAVTPQVVQPGGSILLSPGTGTPYAKANIAAVQVAVVAISI